jgi:hypothetical protein
MQPIVMAHSLAQFVVVSSKKFGGFDGKLTKADYDRLKTGYVESVDGFDHYFRSRWIPMRSVRYRESSSGHKVPLRRKKKPLRHTSVKPDLSWNDLSLFAEVCSDAISQFPMEVQKSRFMKNRARNMIFCAMRQCQTCASQLPSVEVQEAKTCCDITTDIISVCDVKENDVEVNTSPTLVNIEDLHHTNPAEFDKIWNSITGESTGEYSEDCWIRDLTCENVESNPGPIAFFTNFYGAYVADVTVNPFAWRYTVKVHFRLGERLCMKHENDLERLDPLHREFCVFVYNRDWNDDSMLRFASIVESDMGFPRAKEDDWLREFTRECVESNPGPFALNGDTKRNDDGKQQSKLVTQLAHLKKMALRDDKIGVDSRINYNSIVKKRRQNAAHQANMRTLFKESWFNVKVIHTHRLSVVDDLEKIVANLPFELRTCVSWIDILASLSVLIRHNTWEAKYLAIRRLCDEFRVREERSSIVSQVLHVLKSFKIPTINVPRFESMDDSVDPISTLISLVLTFLFGRKPSEDRMRHFVNSLGNIPRSALGVNHLVDVGRKVLCYGKILSDPRSTMEHELNDLHNKVTFWLTQEGDSHIMLNPEGYKEVTDALMRCDEIGKCLAPRSPLKQSHSIILYHLRSLHKKVSSAPVSGHSFRKEPVVLHLVGAAGCGKTLMISAFAADSLKYVFDLNQVPIREQQERLKNFFQYVYWRPIGHKYETNYNTANSKVYVMDDANQIAPDYLGDDLPCPARLIHLANNADLLLPVAEIENKRNAKFASDIIIVTDNNADPDLHYLSSTDAYKRRLTIQVNVSVKPNCTHLVNNIRVIDPSKLSTEYFDVSPYVFKLTDDSKEMSYDEVSDLIKVKLGIKHSEFNVNRKNLISHAMRLFEPKYTETCGDTFTEMSTEIDREAALERPVFENDDEKVLEEEYQDIKDDVSSWEVFWEIFTIIFSIISFKLAFQFGLKRIFHTIGFFFCGVFIKSRILLNRMKTKTVQHKRRSYLIASTGVLLCSAFLIYKRYSKKNPQNEKYNSGEPSKTVHKPKNKPKGKLISVKQSDVTFEKVSANEFSNDAIQESCLDDNAMEMMKKITSSLYYIRVTFNDGSVNRISGFFVQGRIFVCNAHVFDHVNLDINSCTIDLEGVRNSYLSIPGKSVGKWELTHEGQDDNRPYDVVFLEFGLEVKEHVNVSRHLMPRSRYASLKGIKVVVFSLVKENGLWFVYKQHTSILEVIDDWIGSSSEETGLTFNYGCLKYVAQTAPGFCGSLIIVNDPRIPEKICGLHMASYNSSDYCYATMLYKEMFDSISESVDAQALYSFDEKIVKQNLSTKHTIIDNDFEHVTCIPHVIHAQSKTRIKKSILHGQVSAPVKFPASLSYHTNNDVTFHVVNRALKKYLGESLSMSDFRRSVFLAHLRRKFQSTREISEFDIRVAIRGIEGDEFINAINRSSSPGYPFIKLKDFNKSGKTTFLGSDDDFVYDNPILLDEINKYVVCAEANERPMCVFTSTAKDELRSLDRVNLGKTRSFAAAPLHFVVLFRQKFLDLFANVMENRIENSSLVGVNPFSQEWDRSAHYLCRYANPASKQFLAGDFQNFDGTLNRSLLWILHTFFEEEYNRTGDKVSFALWSDITNSIQVFGNCAVEVSRGQPSGNPGTTIINSLYNSALLHAVLYEILTDFGTSESHRIRDNLDSHYRALVYGDDNCMGFSQDFCDLVDPKLISEKMLEFGHIYTSDAKDGSVLCYKTLKDISILKRHFSFDRSLKCWFAPLDLTSILEPLNWDKIEDQQVEAKKMQMTINARNAIRELCMHDEATFDMWVPKIRSVCRINNIELEFDSYLDQGSLRVVLRGLSDLPKTQAEHGAENNARRNFHFERLGGQSPPNRLIDHSLENNSSPLFKQRVATTMMNTMKQQSPEMADGEEHGIVPFIDATVPITSGSEIIAFSTVETPQQETVVAPQDITEETLTVLEEGRDHSIKDIFCREYIIADFTIPVGGTNGQILQQWDVLALFLAQANVHDKLSGFAFFKSNLVLRLEFSTVPTVSGGVMLSFYPDIAPAALIGRTESRLQLSQVPNVQQSLTTAVSMKMRIPWISPFYGRDVVNGFGSIGTVILSRLVPSAIDSVAVKAYISAEESSVHVQYPTTGVPAATFSTRKARARRALLQLEGSDDVQVFKMIEQLDKLPETQSEALSMQKGAISGILNKGQAVAKIATGIPKIGAVAAAAAPLLGIAGKLAAMFGLSKPLNDQPVRAIKYKPGDGHLANEGVLPSHTLTLNQGCSVSSENNPFGSAADEMALSAIMKSPNIIGSFSVSTANPARFVLYQSALNLTKFETVGVLTPDHIRMTHQTWVASLFNQWNASLIFGFDAYLTHFHRVKLRFIVLPNVYPSDLTGAVLPSSFDLNLASSAVVEFSGDNVNYTIEIDPRSNTGMKLMPSSAGATANTVMNWQIQSNFVQCSYGTLLVMVEVPLKATSNVANTVHFTTSFSADNVELTNPVSGLTFFPLTQSESTLGTAYTKETRSEMMVRNTSTLSSNSVDINSEMNIKLCAGDSAISLRNLLNAFTVFTPTLAVAATGSLRLRPFVRRSFGDSPSNIDLFDYLTKGYAFFKGSMNVRLALSDTPTSGCAGKLGLISAWNQQAPGVTPVVGFSVGVTPNAGPGTRCVPIAASEAVVDVSVPYYQAWHITRSLQNGSTGVYGEMYENGLIYGADTSQSIQVYRAIGDDFRMGFLMSLPEFIAAPTLRWT